MPQSIGVCRRFGLTFAQTLNSTAAEEQAMADSKLNWDFEADVVVIGGGGAGLPAAVKAADSRALGIVVEANYDEGGPACFNGRKLPLGGWRPTKKQIRTL